MPKGKSGGGRKTFDAFRDADTGYFITEEEAQSRDPKEWIKERVPKRRFGDTDGK